MLERKILPNILFRKTWLYKQPFHSRDLSELSCKFYSFIHGYINNHFIHFSANNKFNFQKYIKRSLDDDFKRVIGIRFVKIFLAIKSMVFSNNMDYLPVTFLSPFVLFPLKTSAYNFLPNTQVVALFAVLLCGLLPWALCLSICIVSLHYSMSYS